MYLFYVWITKNLSNVVHMHIDIQINQRYYYHFTP